MTASEVPVRPSRRDTAYVPAGNTPSQIEVDVATTRAELGETLGALERKLAPRQLLGCGVDVLKNVINGTKRPLRPSSQGQPLPLALVGLSIGLLLLSQRTRPRPSQAAHETDERARERTANMRETVTDTTSHSAEPIGFGRTRGKSSAMPDNADAADNAQNHPSGRASGLTSRHPLALGAASLLAGAVVALVLPRSAAEERLTGPVGDWVREEAANLGCDVLDRAQYVAERTVDVAVEVARDAINDVGKV
jgi:hypothetical protein